MSAVERIHSFPVLLVGRLDAMPLGKTTYNKKILPDVKLFGHLRSTVLD